MSEKNEFNNAEYFEEFRQFSYFWGGKTILDGILTAFENIKENETLTDSQKITCFISMVSSVEATINQEIEKLPHHKLWLNTRENFTQEDKKNN